MSISCWEFAYLYGLVELAGHRSYNSMKAITATIPGAPSTTTLDKHKNDIITRRLAELKENPIPDFGDVISLHDNAAAMGYIQRHSRQSSHSTKNRICTLVLALLTRNKDKPFQFLQSESRFAPYAVWARLSEAPSTLLVQSEIESDYLYRSFLDRIKEALDKMICDGYEIGDGSKEKNAKPDIAIPSETDVKKSRIVRVCPSCNYRWPYKCTKQTCYEVLHNDLGEKLICGYKLPSKQEAMINYILEEDNDDVEDAKFRRIYYADASESFDFMTEQELKLKSKLIDAAKMVCEGGDPRDYCHHQGGKRKDSDDAPPLSNVYSEEYLRAQRQNSSSQSFGTLGRELQETIEAERGGYTNVNDAEKNTTRDVEAEEGCNDDEEGVPVMDIQDIASCASRKRRLLGVMKSSNSKSTRNHCLKIGKLDTIILPQGVVHGNPGTAEVMKQLEIKRLKDAKVLEKSLVFIFINVMLGFMLMMLL